MVASSRTLGPLHFEDLEPKRFEDLTRQLIYDFRPWRRLEATGRAGADDGFDARGYEMVDVTQSPESDGVEDEAALAGADDRLWLVQCKREKSIGPKKLLEYLGDIKLKDDEKLHGIVFAAACDFSKAARDKFASHCEAQGIVEWHLWGKAEMEDKLLRPENDGLLFAYFGLSLTIRRRSQRADLRAKLVMKRKANRLLGDKENSYLLLRSPDASSYPDSDAVVDFDKNPPWVVRRYSGLCHDGLKFSLRCSYAYLSEDGKTWDAALCYNTALGHTYDDPWSKRARVDPTDDELRLAWNQLAEPNRAWLEVVGVIAFEDVLEIDELGDEHFREPHIYAQFSSLKGPFKYRYRVVANIDRVNQRELYVPDIDENRVQIFPNHLRAQSPKG